MKFFKNRKKKDENLQKIDGKIVKALNLIPPPYIFSDGFVLKTPDDYIDAARNFLSNYSDTQIDLKNDDLLDVFANSVGCFEKKFGNQQNTEHIQSINQICAEAEDARKRAEEYAELLNELLNKLDEEEQQLIKS